MLSIQATTLLLLLVLCTTGNAFVPSSSPHAGTITSSSLNVGLSYDDAEDPYFQLLQRANDCAKDEECSLEEWDSVVNEMEYISDMETEELSHLVEGIHQLEERSALSPWTNSRNLPIVVLMFVASTMNTLSHDDIIVTRIGWFLQDWNQVATQSNWGTTELPLFMCAVAAYVAVSEVASGFLPSQQE